MSKTDKTRPFLVRLADHGDLVAQEVHNHRHSDCNLPELTVEAMSVPPRRSQDCYWTFRYDGTNICGCKMCTMRDERHQERKSLRREEAVTLKNVTKACNSGASVDDLDVFVPSRRF